MNVITIFALALSTIACVGFLVLDAQGYTHRKEIEDLKYKFRDMGDYNGYNDFENN